ncbi:MAG: hypothetical protein WDO74_10895 [Pseudomonadota bacterium]
MTKVQQKRSTNKKLKEHRRLAEVKLLSVAPANDEAPEYEPRRGLIRFTLTLRRRLHLARVCGVAAGQWVEGAR